VGRSYAKRRTNKERGIYAKTGDDGSEKASNAQPALVIIRTTLAFMAATLHWIVGPMATAGMLKIATFWQWLQEAKEDAVGLDPFQADSDLAVDTRSVQNLR
jgi:hypothetical protein